MTLDFIHSVPGNTKVVHLLKNCYKITMTKIVGKNTIFTRFNVMVSVKYSKHLVESSWKESSTIILSKAKNDKHTQFFGIRPCQIHRKIDL